MATYLYNMEVEGNVERGKKSYLKEGRQQNGSEQEERQNATHVLYMQKPEFSHVDKTYVYITRTHI